MWQKSTQISVIDRTASRRRAFPRGGRFHFSGPYTPSAAVENWNDNVRVGAQVTYWGHDGHTIDTATCSKAKLQDGQAVIWLYGCSLAPLDRVLMR